jgi:hypothetical protein
MVNIPIKIASVTHHFRVEAAADAAAIGSIMQIPCAEMLSSAVMGQVGKYYTVSAGRLSSLFTG